MNHGDVDYVPLLPRALDSDDWQRIAMLARYQAEWIIERAKQTPFTHIPGYMERYWLFNPYLPHGASNGLQYPDLPSIRVHRILRADNARHPHNNPRDSRSILLKGAYDERTDDGVRVRLAGDTMLIPHDKYHHIEKIHGDVWTLFITGPYIKSWDFRTENGKVPWREYLATHQG